MQILGFLKIFLIFYICSNLLGFYVIVFLFFFFLLIKKNNSILCDRVTGVLHLLKRKYKKYHIISAKNVLKYLKVAVTNSTKVL
jgi:hypothetical protein